MNTSSRPCIDWYFDFISPFAWLQAEELAVTSLDAQLVCKPVLFAGLLAHWGQLGPAEIPAKRRFTYEYVVWLAGKRGLPVRLPPVHPFNPLKLLRLSVLAGPELSGVLRVFRFVWSEGCSADDPADWKRLTADLSLSDADARLDDPDVKRTVRDNGEEAVARGVFGVPTALVGERLFWGADATGMLLDYLHGDACFASTEMSRAATLPIGKARPQAHPSAGGAQQ
ncbi:MAG TPA: 2-hydroxychromene-2-carboxylate isomerase [Burkholderiales bacterium]|nr:2-hydroxychromene-2-carboxylate isomerase [Burkholderiales bacterium]